MKRSTTTLLGVTTLTAAVVGFGAAVPSLADDLTSVVAGGDQATATDEAQDGGAAGTTDPAGRPDGAEGPRGSHHGPGHHGPGRDLGAAAETLGLTQEELRTQLRGGSTLGEVADAQGVDRDTLVDALLDQERERITAMLDEQPPAQGSGHGAPEGDAPDGAGTEGDGASATTEDPSA